jgi:hypothetical protein
MNLRNRQLIPSFSRPPSRVLIRKVARYADDLLAVTYESLREFALPIKDKTVFLKANLVGHDPHGFINTHPAVITAAREAFLKLGAARVLIGDGPALDRDTQAILESVRLREFTGPLTYGPGRDFCDLNIDDVEPVPLETRASLLKELYLPKTVLGADFFVSMPKLKTHHWAGVTLSMKNLFGIVPEAAMAGRKTSCTGPASTAPSSISTPPLAPISSSWTASSEWKGMAPFREIPSTLACSCSETTRLPRTPPLAASCASARKKWTTSAARVPCSATWNPRKFSNLANLSPPSGPRLPSSPNSRCCATRS